MSAVLLIADDFGMSKEVNDAIEIAQQGGSVHGVSLMVDQEASADAIRRMAALPEMRVGLHLNFSDRRDVRPGSPWSAFPWRTGFPITHREAVVPRFAERFRRETRAQFEAFAQTGRPLAFVNGHHHMHIQPVIFAEVCRCLADLFPAFDGWIRLGQSRFFGMPAWPLDWMATLAMTRDPVWEGKKTTHVWGSFPAFHTRADAVVRLIEAVPVGRHEIYVHPGARKPRRPSPVSGDEGQDRSIDAKALADERIRDFVRRTPVGRH